MSSYSAAELRAMLEKAEAHEKSEVQLTAEQLEVLEIEKEIQRKQATPQSLQYDFSRPYYNIIKSIQV